MQAQRTQTQTVRASALALLSVLLSGCYSHYGAVENVATPDDAHQLARIVSDIEYAREGWPESPSADLYLPDRQGKLPVVITIHGGAWANRSRADMDDIGRKLVRHGYAVLNVSYRFAPRYQHPAQLNDLHQALAWLQRNADRYDLDIERINTWGFSSGAHLAALVAASEPPADAADLPRIRAVVAGGIPSDLRKYPEGPIVERFLGGKRDEMPERYAHASPVYHISADDPPVFIYHGTLDWLVGQHQATDYYDALVANGVEAELYLHRWRGHTTLFLFGGDAEDKAIAFLHRKNQRTAPVVATRDLAPDL